MHEGKSTLLDSIFIRRQSFAIEVLGANARYAADFGKKSKLPLPPGRKSSS
jgi:hypothetical protein